MARGENHILYGLPQEIGNKINKTKQTRGAQPPDRVIYQNRVNRNTNIAVVPYYFRDVQPTDGYESGHVIMVRPTDYFSAAGVVRPDFDPAVMIGENAFVIYDNRREYVDYPPLPHWKPRSHGGPGHVVYRLPKTTARDGVAAAAKVDGDAQGIRFFEYASTDEANGVVVQLAMLAWHTEGINDVRTDGQATGVPRPLLDAAEAAGLWDKERLQELGVLTDAGAICPLCRLVIKASELMSRVEQAQGREVFDLTVTEVNLFHMQDLKPGEFNHRTYAVGWGHHHCNAVARDHGLAQTLDWMADVLRRNGVDVRR